LIDEEAVTAGKLFGALANTVGEINRFLINDQFLKGEAMMRRIESRE
jgi:hypothetical protein